MVDRLRQRGRVDHGGRRAAPRPAPKWSRSSAAAPDGTNINAGCGSTDPSGLAAAVVANGAACGLAFDGDADRVIAVDGSGEGGRRRPAAGAVRDSTCAARGGLAGDTVVVTVMTNLGLPPGHGRGRRGRARDPGGRPLRPGGPGAEHGWSLGGEQSGPRDLQGPGRPPGTACCPGSCCSISWFATGRPLADLAAGAMERLPQVLRNVPVADRDALAGAEPVWAEVRGGRGRTG